ncbi:MAG: hypothetical protein LBU32_21190 [Clostridiales bacterium]|jgi:hypothetical protein|nr:hypothetical protein [Clostridiales bacterium]
MRKASFLICRPFMSLFKTLPQSQIFVLSGGSNSTFFPQQTTLALRMETIPGWEKPFIKRFPCPSSLEVVFSAILVKSHH